MSNHLPCMELESAVPGASQPRRPQRTLCIARSGQCHPRQEHGVNPGSCQTPASASRAPQLTRTASTIAPRPFPGTLTHHTCPLPSAPRQGPCLGVSWTPGLDSWWCLPEQAKQLLLPPQHCLEPRGQTRCPGSPLSRRIMGEQVNKARESGCSAGVECGPGCPAAHLTFTATHVQGWRGSRTKPVTASSVPELPQLHNDIDKCARGTVSCSFEF